MDMTDKNPSLDFFIDQLEKSGKYQVFAVRSSVGEHSDVASGGKAPPKHISFDEDIFDVPPRPLPPKSYTPLAPADSASAFLPNLSSTPCTPQR